jgi:glycosyltransferase involved in cell wall biosynthesis
MPRHEVRQGIAIDRPRYLHLPGRARGNASAFARAGLRSLLAGDRPDVVVADYAWPAGAIAPLLGRHALPCVINGRGSDVLQVTGEAGLGEQLASYLKAAGHWCAVSDDLLSVMDRLGQAPGRGILVPNGVDLEAFRIGDPGAARDALGLPRDRALVLVVGHWIPRKDPLLALDAFLAGAPDDALCAFVGRGPLEAELRARANDAGAGERVRLVGEVRPEELGSWYTAADLLLLTSRREGRPNVVLEALASGRPVLATEAGGTGELLGEFRQRCLSSRRDAEHLGAMLKDLLAHPPQAEELRASVAELSWDRSLDALEDCLRAAIETVAA